MECIGTILLVLGVILFFVGRSEQAKGRAIGATETYTAALLHQIHGQVVPAVGADALMQRCEISGTTEADMPLNGPLSRRPCVYYEVTASREYEEQVTSTDSQGKTTRSMQRGSEVIETNKQQHPFWVRDATGRVRVDPEGANLDLEESANQFEESNDIGLSNRRTLGIRRVERILPLGSTVFVHGYARDRQGEVMVARNVKNEGVFLVSRKTEQELLSSSTKSTRWLQIGAAASGAIGLIVLVIGLLT